MNKNDLKNLSGIQLQGELNAIRLAAGNDETSDRYKEAERNAQPIIDEMNERAEDIAKRFNKKAQRISFRTFNRNMQHRMGIR